MPNLEIAESLTSDTKLWCHCSYIIFQDSTDKLPVDSLIRWTLDINNNWSATAMAAQPTHIIAVAIAICGIEIMEWSGVVAMEITF